MTNYTGQIFLTLIHESENTRVFRVTEGAFVVYASFPFEEKGMTEWETQTEFFAQKGHALLFSQRCEEYISRYFEEGEEAVELWWETTWAPPF